MIAPLLRLRRVVFLSKESEHEALVYTAPVTRNYHSLHAVKQEPLFLPYFYQQTDPSLLFHLIFIHRAEQMSSSSESRLLQLIPFRSLTRQLRRSSPSPNGPTNASSQHTTASSTSSAEFEAGPEGLDIVTEGVNPIIE